MVNHQNTQTCHLAAKERTQQNAPTTGDQEPNPAVSAVLPEKIEPEMYHLSIPKGGWMDRVPSTRLSIHHQKQKSNALTLESLTPL